VAAAVLAAAADLAATLATLSVVAAAPSTRARTKFSPPISGPATARF